MRVKIQRNFRQIERTFTRLIEKDFPKEQSLRFAAGYTALHGHQNILNEVGYALLKKATEFIESNKTVSSDEIVNQFEELVLQFPTVAEPKLNLFISPTAKLSDAEMQILRSLFKDDDETDGPWMFRRYRYRIVQITHGCPNQCLICATDAPSKMIHMPYPMILAIAKEVMEPGTTILPHYANDPFSYRDVQYNADFGDVAIQLKSMGYDLNMITHGWWERDDYAKEAAEKIGRLGRGVSLSVHFFHRQVVDSQGDEEKNKKAVDVLVDRFRTVAQLLKPRDIRLFGFNRFDATEDMPIEFQSSYVNKIFSDRVSGESSYCAAIYQEGRGRKLFEEYGVRIGPGPSIYPRGEHAMIRPWGGVEKYSVQSFPGRKHSRKKTWGFEILPFQLFTGIEA